MTVPAHGDDTTAAADPLALLRDSVDALPSPEGTDGPPGTDDAFDAAEHAARFEAVHDALVAVLADVDRT